MRRLIVLWLLINVTSAWADEAAPPTIAEAIEQSKAANKPLVLDFYTTWCGPCTQFKQTVLPKKEVQRALGEVIFVQYDAEAGPGIEAARRYSVHSYPTFLVVDGKGVDRRRKSGAMSADAFVAWVEDAKLAILSDAALHARLRGEPNNAALLLFVARHHRNLKHTKLAESYYRRAVKAGGGNDTAAEAAWECMELMRYAKARAQLVEQLFSFVRDYPSHERASSALVTVAMAGSIGAAQKKALAEKLVQSAQAGNFNSTIYDLLAASEPEAALSVGKLQVEASPDDANAYDSLAEVLHVLGRKDEAVAASDRALELGKTHASHADFLLNNQRFRRGNSAEGDISVVSRRTTALRELASLPGTYPSYQDVKLPEDPRRAAARAKFEERRMFSLELSKVLKAVADKCAASVAHPGLWVRVRLKAVSAVPTKTWVLEPEIRGSLRRCLQKGLRTAVFPAPIGDNRDFTREIDVPAKDNAGTTTH